MELFDDDNFIEKVKLIDKIRDEFNQSQMKIDLPQIIVVGDQSSGKSSIIEAISGIKLPRGLNTTTVCPLIIQMKKSKMNHLSISFRGEVIKDSWNADTNEIISQIQKERLFNKITNDPITLQKESPDLPNLTLIDLPGMVKTKSDNHDDNIINDTQNMAVQYMVQSHSIILCVMPAIIDINSTQTIELAKEKNPDLTRIIGVLTKIDRADEDKCEIEKVLLNEKIKLAKGFVGVEVSSSYLASDQNQRKNIEDKLKEKFTMTGGQIGIQCLVEKLKIELNVIIDKNFPEMETFIKDRISEYQKILSTTPNFHNDESLQKRHLIDVRDEIVKHFRSRMEIGNKEISGHLDMIKCMISEIEIPHKLSKECTFTYCWSTIYNFYTFNLEKIYKNQFKLDGGKYKDLTKLNELMEQRRTETISLFFNNQAFVSIITSVLSEMRNESIRIIELFDKIIKNIIESYLKKKTEYEILNENLRKRCLLYYDNVSKEARKKIEFIFDLENNPYMPDARFVVFSEKYDKSKKSESSSTKIVPSIAHSSGDINRENAYNHLPRNPIHNNNSAMISQNQQSSITPSSSSNTINLIDRSAGKSNSNAEKMKAFLEFYIEDLINRLTVLIPNVIQVSLFKAYAVEIENGLADFIIDKAIYDCFKLSPDKEKYFGDVESKLHSSNKCLKYINDFKDKNK